MEFQTILPVDKKSTQKWHEYNLAKTNEKKLFYRLLHELVQCIPEPEYKFGRPRVPIKDLTFALGLKLYSNYSSRKVSSDVYHARQVGYITKDFHFNRLTEFLQTPGVYDLFKKLVTISAMPLRQLEDSGSMDASGFGSYQYERWKRLRFSPNYHRGSRNYLKGSILIGTRTNCIISCEASYGNLHDLRFAPELLKDAKHFDLKEISADKGYSSKQLLEVIGQMSIRPYILFKGNARLRDYQESTMWYKSLKHFRDNKQEFLEHYHKRSNVETVFSMVKLRLGEFLKCKTYEAQRNELLMKFICHNICCLIQEIYENKISVDFRDSVDKFLKKDPTFRDTLIK